MARILLEKIMYNSLCQDVSASYKDNTYNKFILSLMREILRWLSKSVSDFIS